MKKFTLLMAIIVMTAMVSKAQFTKDMEGLIGFYDFADTEDVFKNTATEAGIGTVMCEGVMKFLPDAPSGDEDDQPSIEGEDYEIVAGINNNAIALKAYNWFKAWHGIPANGGGAYVNDYTVVVDVNVSSADGIYSLLEINPTPKEAGYSSEMEIEYLKVGSVDKPWSEEGIPHSTNTMTVDTWYRIVYVAKLAEYIQIYVNGELWNSIEGEFTDSRPAPYGADLNPDDAAIKIGGNHETIENNDPPRDGDKIIDMFAIFNRFLSAEEVLSLAGPGSWLGVNDIQNENNIMVYPNPANDVLNISVTHASKLEIVNVTGQIVESTPVEGQTSIDVSQLNKGIYFVRITDSLGNTSSQKVIIE